MQKENYVKTQIFLEFSMKTFHGSMFLSKPEIWPGTHSKRKKTVRTGRKFVDRFSIPLNLLKWNSG